MNFHCLAKIHSSLLNLDDDQCIAYDLRQRLSIAYSIIIVLHLPIMLYGLWHSYQYRESIIMQKRHIVLTLTLGIGYLIQTAILALLILCHGSFLKYSTIGKTVFAICALNGLYLNFIILIKVWIHFYDIKFNRILLLNSWTQVIADINAKHTWWIANRNTVGSYKYLLKRVIIFVIIFCIIIIILMTCHISPNGDIETLISAVIEVTFLVTPIVLTVCIGIRLPQFHDNFAIKKETYWICIVVFVAAIMIMIRVGLKFVIADKYQIVAEITQYFLLAISAFTIHMLSTEYVLRKNAHLLKQETVEDSVDIEIETKFESSSHSSILQELRNILLDENGLELLSNHLIHEFSIEIILCYIEMTQYKLYILDCVGVGQNDTDTLNVNNWDVSNLYNFPSLVPKSRLVYSDLNDEETTLLTLDKYENEKSIMEMKIRAYHIYKRYIAVSSAYETNVDQNTKNELIALLDNFDKWLLHSADPSYLFHLFDPCIEQMDNLLQKSFKRLKASRAYQVYIASKPL